MRQKTRDDLEIAMDDIEAMQVIDSAKHLGSKHTRILLCVWPSLNNAIKQLSARGTTPRRMREKNEYQW